MVNKGTFIKHSPWHKPGTVFYAAVFFTFLMDFELKGYKRKKGRVNTHPFH
jgi:hypothetical protein